MIFDELLHFDWLSEWSKNRHPFRAFLFVESVVNRIRLWIGIGKLQKKSIDYSLTLFGSVSKLSSSVSLIFPLSILAWYWLILYRCCLVLVHLPWKIRLRKFMTEWLKMLVSFLVWSSGPSFSKGWYCYPVYSAIDFPTYKIRCIVIYPLDSASRRFNNWRLLF